MVPVLIAFVIAVMCSVVLFFANPTITRVIGDAEYGKSGKSGKRMKVDNAMAKAAKKEKVKMSFDFLLTTEKIIDKKYLPELLDDSHTCIEVSDIKHREKYMNSKNIMKTTLHNGQLKLLLTEIQFLTYILSSCYDKAYVIYAGSAPSNKLGILRIMFPNIKFILVDPNEHRIMFPSFSNKVTDQYDEEYIKQLLYFKFAKGNRFEIRNRKINVYGKGIIDRDNNETGTDIPDDICNIIKESDSNVFIIEDYMNNPLSEILAGLKDRPLYFISDIRTTEEGEFPSNGNVHWNNVMQYSWLKRINPIKYMLKFHAPFIGDPIIYETHMKSYLDEFPVDITKKFKLGKYTYLKNEKLFIQAFAPQSSTEIRLIGSSLELFDYDITELEEKMFFYNTIQRPIGVHHSCDPYLDMELGIDNCADCALMCHIIKKYYDKYYGNSNRVNILGLVKSIMNCIDRTLVAHYIIHGFYSLPKLIPGGVKDANTTFQSFVTSATDIAELLYVHLSCRQFNMENYKRWKTPATIENQLYKLAVNDRVIELCNKFAPAKDFMLRIPSANNGAAKAKIAISSVFTADMFGDSEFELDMINKCYRMFLDYKKAYETIKQILREEMSKKHKLPDNLVYDKDAGKCRNLSDDVVKLCHIASGGRIPSSYRSRELDNEIFSIIKKHGIDHVVEVNNLRTSSYFDCQINGYKPKISSSDVKYTNYSIYGGENIFNPAQKFDDKTLIIFRINGLSQICITFFYWYMLKTNPNVKLISLTEANTLSFRNYTKIAYEKICNDKNCNMIECTTPLYVVYHNLHD
jgi:hypothetical protein